MLAYLVGVSFFLLVWAALYITEPRSRHTMLAASLGLAPFGPILQHWYVRDYWQPEYLWTLEVGGVLLSVEDCLFAFSFAGISAGIFDWLRRRRSRAFSSVQIGATIVRLQISSLVLVASTVVLVEAMGVNSVHATLLSCSLGVAVVLGRRGDLVPIAAAAASATALLFWAFYELFFLRLYPLIFVDWWDQSALSGLQLGAVPIEEIAWAWAVALFVGPAVAVCAAPLTQNQLGGRAAFGNRRGEPAPRNESVTPVLLLGGLAAACAEPAHAATEQLGVLPESAAAVALVGGRFATAADPNALRHSPALILDLDRPTTQINFGAWKPDVDYFAPTGETTYVVDDWKYLPSAYHVRPLAGGKSAFGIGLSTPYGLNYEYPRDSVFRYLIPYEAMLLTVDITPVYAFEVSDRLSLGIGLDIIYSEIDLKQDYPWVSVTGIPGTPDGVFNYNGDGWGFGAFAGFSLSFPNGHRLAAALRLPVEIEYDGEFSATQFPTPLASVGFSPTSEFGSEIEYPGLVSIGYAHKINDRLTISGDLEWAQNSVHESLPLSIGNNQPLLGTDRLILNWDDAMSIGVAAQRRLRDGLTLRTSYLYTETSMPDFTFTPAVASNDRHLFSVGAGYTSGAHVFDFSYSYVRMEDRNVAANQQPRYVGQYTFDWQVFTFSYSFRH